MFVLSYKYKLKLNRKEVMYMNIDKMTVRVQQSLNDAQMTAVKYNQQQVDTIHLFSALINQEFGLIPSVLERMNINLDLLR